MTTPMQHVGSVDAVLLPQYRAVLVPLGGSRRAERALEPARWLAAHFGAELHTVPAGLSPDTGWYRRHLAGVRREMPGVVPHTSRSSPTSRRWPPGTRSRWWRGAR